MNCLEGHEFQWNEPYQAMFVSLTVLVSTAITLHHFNMCRPLVVKVNASKCGLNAALLLNRVPVTFTPKAIFPFGQRYVNIEYELFKSMLDAEQLKVCICRCHFIVKLDHKPLEQISPKYLSEMLTWLQHMLLCLQGYDFQLRYHPGGDGAPRCAFMVFIQGCR